MANGLLNSAGSVANGAPSQMANDWNSYFNSQKPGQSVDWGGGTLTMGDDGNAIYKAQGAVNGGTTLNRNSISNPNSLQSIMAENPGIAKQWGSQYGVDAGLTQGDQNYYSNLIAGQGQGRTYDGFHTADNSNDSNGTLVDAQQSQQNTNDMSGGYSPNNGAHQMLAGGGTWNESTGSWGGSNGLDQNAMNANPSGYAAWQQGAAAQEKSHPGSTYLSQGGSNGQPSGNGMNSSQSFGANGQPTATSYRGTAIRAQGQPVNNSNAGSTNGYTGSTNNGTSYIQSGGTPSYLGGTAGTSANGLTTGVTSGNIQNSYDNGGQIQKSYDNGGPIQNSYDSGGNIQRNVQTNNLNGLMNSFGYGNIQNGVNMSGVSPMVSGDALSGQMTTAQRAAYAQDQSRLDPTWNNQQHDLENKLTQQGIMQNSDAWNRAMDDFTRQRTDAYQTAQNNSVGLGNAAQNQLFNQGLSTNQNSYSQALNNGTFANAAQNQGASQALQNATLNNSVNNQQYNQNLSNAQFVNSAQNQSNTQNQNAATFHNSAQNQSNLQNQNAATFNNQAQNQSNTQNKDAANFYNTSQNQQFNQGVTNANLNNNANLQNFNTGLASKQFDQQANLQNFNTGLASKQFDQQANQQTFNQNLLTRQQNYNESKDAKNTDTAKQNAITNGLFGLGTAALTNPKVLSYLGTLGGGLIDAAGKITSAGIDYVKNNMNGAPPASTTPDTAAAAPGVAIDPNSPSGYSDSDGNPTDKYGNPTDSNGEIQTDP